MKKILLICDMGMSTSLVVKRMQEAATEQSAAEPNKEVSTHSLIPTRLSTSLVGTGMCL